MSTALLLSIAACFAPQGQPGDSEAPTWTWILGTLESERQQTAYVEFAGRMHRYYQGLGLLIGPLTTEAALPEARPEHAVFIGPIDVLPHPEWLDPALQFLGGGAVRLAGVELRTPRTGIYLQSLDGSQVLYSGLSLDGFQGIFSVPTGQHACTVTIDGKVRFEGDWVGETLKLEALPFLARYPSLAELAAGASVEDALTLRDVYAGRSSRNLTPAFKQRLGTLVQDQRVLFVGESHWNVGVNRLFNEVLEELLEQGGVGAVFLELSESYSGYFNHYVSLADEAEAALFLRDEIHPRVNVQSLMELLALLRRWNLAHPAAAVQVACLDMEWGVSLLVEGTLLPFFRGLDPEFELSVPSSPSASRWKRELAEMRRLLEVAREQDHVGRYPFLTADHVAQMLTNLEDTLALGKNVTLPRQKAIVRNITEFHGELLGAGLVVFKGGSFHANRHASAADDGYYRDAAYLDQVHPPTRGRVVSLGLVGLGYSFIDVAGVDMTRRQASATKYHAFVRDFQAGLQDGSSTESDVYLLGGQGLDPLPRLVAQTGEQRSRNVLWLDEMDDATLLARHGLSASDLWVAHYDEVIYVLRSELEVTRPRKWPQ